MRIFDFIIRNAVLVLSSFMMTGNYLHMRRISEPIINIQKTCMGARVFQ